MECHTAAYLEKCVFLPGGLLRAAGLPANDTITNSLPGQKGAPSCPNFVWRTPTLAAFVSTLAAAQARDPSYLSGNTVDPHFRWQHAGCGDYRQFDERIFWSSYQRDGGKQEAAAAAAAGGDRQRTPPASWAGSDERDPSPRDERRVRSLHDQVLGVCRARRLNVSTCARHFPATSGAKHRTGAASKVEEYYLGTTRRGGGTGGGAAAGAGGDARQTLRDAMLLCCADYKALRLPFPAWLPTDVASFCM